MSERANDTPSLVGTNGVRAYVNERGVDVASGATALDAVRALSPELADHVTGGTARLTDSRGLPIAATHIVHGGLILRVLPVRTRAVLDAGDPME